MFPQKKESGLSKLMSVGKIVGGLYAGGPMGYLAAAEGTAGLANSNKSSPNTVPTTDSSAMSRRMDASGDEGGFMGQLAALRDGEQALNELPHEVRQEYTKPLFNTIMAAHKDYMDRLARGEKLS